MKNAKPYEYRFENFSSHLSNFFFHLENFGKHFQKFFLRKKNFLPPKNKGKFWKGELKLHWKKFRKTYLKIFLCEKRNLRGEKRIIYGFGEKMGQPSPITCKSSNFFKSPSSLNLYKWRKKMVAFRFFILVKVLSCFSIYRKIYFDNINLPKNILQ
jgi:hypothetical protein